MRRLERLEKIYKLIKLQEQNALTEFKQIQKINSELKLQIYDLAQHSKHSSEKIINKNVLMSEVNIIKQFNGKIEVVLNELNNKLIENEKNFITAAEKIKEIRSRLKSVERLTNRHQQKRDYEEQKYIQIQIDENINYQLGTKAKW